MKRGQPLVRYVPLRSTSSLRPVSRKRLSENRHRKAVVAAMYASAPWCARCGVTYGLSGHERLGRSQGGDARSPDCLLCGRCQVWCEDNPREAAEAGWKVSRKWGGDAA